MNIKDVNKTIINLASGVAKMADGDFEGLTPCERVAILLTLMATDKKFADALEGRKKGVVEVALERIAA